MTIVKASCVDCGPAAYPAEEVTVVVNEGEGHGIYMFECSTCHTLRTHKATRAIVTILIIGGAELQVNHPITEAEIEAFVAQLDGMEWT